MATADQQRRWRDSHPWMRHLEHARARCNQPSHEMHYAYGGRGIRCELTAAQVRSLWERDGAAAMRKPTIDRIDSDGNYELANCRFVPRSENLRCPRPLPKEKYPSREVT